MSGIFSPTAMAAWFPLPAVWGRPIMAGARHAVGVRRLWLPNFGDSGDDFPGHANPFASLVPCHVVGDHAEERRQRIGAATRARAEEL